jgi:hypothetical protein
MSRSISHRETAYPRGRPKTLPFTSPQVIRRSTERFELEVPECSARQVLDFQFFPPGRAQEAVASSSDIRIVLPTGAVLLVNLNPVSRPAALRIVPL